MPRKLTTSIFIEKAKKIHGDKYDYSLVDYKNARTKIKIICKEHGIYEQRPNEHTINNRGCPKCSNNYKLTTKEFIKKANQIHGDKYDYSLVDYKNSKSKVKIICHEHGIFEQISYKHVIGHGCSDCSKNKKSNTNEFIKKAKQIHGDKYDYSLVNYKNSKSKVKIICKEHGVFEQRPNVHLNGHECKFCYLDKKKSNTNEFIKKAKKNHKDKFDYSLVKYKNNKIKVKIICHKHGIFEQKPQVHLKGSGCFKCFNDKKSSNTEKFIKKTKKIHGNKYDYSLVDYKNAKIKVKIICKEHGIYEQRPNEHLNGSGCPNCFKSKGEIFIKNYLINNKIFYEEQKKFNITRHGILKKIADCS